MNVFAIIMICCLVGLFTGFEALRLAARTGKRKTVPAWIVSCSFFFLLSSVASEIAVCSRMNCDDIIYRNNSASETEQVYVLSKNFCGSAKIRSVFVRPGKTVLIRNSKLVHVKKTPAETIPAENEKKEIK